MNNNQVDLPNLIKKITFHFIKIHYENYLKDNKLEKIPESDIEKVINDLYDEKKSELKKYVRGTLRQNYPDYDTNYMMKTGTEEILLEMFDDPDYSKNRLVIEIKNYQI